MTLARLALMVVLQAILLESVAPFGEWTRPQWALWALFMVPPQAGAFTKLGAPLPINTWQEVAPNTL